MRARRGRTSRAGCENGRSNTQAPRYLTPPCSPDTCDRKTRVTTSVTFRVLASRSSSTRSASGCRNIDVSSNAPPARQIDERDGFAVQPRRDRILDFNRSQAGMHTSVATATRGAIDGCRQGVEERRACRRYRIDAERALLMGTPRPRQTRCREIRDQMTRFS
jgi:hypothetical protein